MNNVLHASTPFTNDVLVYHKKRHRYQNNYCICKQFRTHRYTFLSCRPPNQNHQIAYHTLIRHLMNGPLKQVMVANLRDHKQNSTHNKSECEALKRLQHQTLQDNATDDTGTSLSSKQHIQDYSINNEFNSTAENRKNFDAAGSIFEENNAVERSHVSEQVCDVVYVSHNVSLHCLFSSIFDTYVA